MADYLLDILLGIPIIFAVYHGFKRGLIYQLATLAALILGIWGAIEFSDLMTIYLAHEFNVTTEYLPLISFILTFVVIVLLVHLIGKVAEKLLETIALGPLNSILGILFSLIKTLLLLSVLLVFINHLDSKFEFLPKKMKEKSLLYEPVSRLAPSLFPYLNFNKDTKSKRNPYLPQV